MYILNCISAVTSDLFYYDIILAKNESLLKVKMLKFLLINFDWDIACWIYSHVVVNNKKIPSLFLKAMLYHKKEY